MAESDKNEIFMSPAPHVVTPVKTQTLMLDVIIALLPLTAYGIYLFSIPALVRIIVSVLCCVGFESLFRLICNLDIRVKDLSAVITGLLIALVIPPNLPIWMLILGCLFAIVVGKEFFGGLGANVFNPALVGRAFMFVSFSGAMTSWIQPGNSFFDAMSTATPLKLINAKEGIALSASEIAKTLNLGSSTDLYTQLILGNHAGCIGETSILLILLGFAYLLFKKVIDWRTPVTMMVTAVAITAIGGINPILTLTSGGLAFGAVFMATDYVTSPVTPKGKLLFGAGCGLITGLIRLFSGMPEGVMYSILIMNAVVPFLNKIIPVKYGYVKPPKKNKEAAK
ncbi:RnfABCDGE type electron transport complex subunit D [Treponema denticola]|uniref:Ion-translocating oxidoreductase complex subunit D n=2 Tax=Treponema denticola TaxID=158 RepID=M2BJ93_TREDN|nr:RnfABCDGE type electron transport complex subunit D [Treponema denticola]EMB25097.1 electron transport complex, rnfabcdge type, D subunit [Treponema denticola SP33]EPF36713.1 electron transport complex, rnfabcdge type, D subunit [Treponema denticola SP32]UTC89932.1 RnfABCDGE type electron transport complex subunit D [Treponema denticola]UTD00716.1 RnfABCDGE type electron transport complex subunit D [Treponema denticola]UTD05545.1 RnfABCDGE type electron transport complex subunit D [Treponem